MGKAARERPAGKRSITMKIPMDAKLLSMMAKVFSERVCGEEETGCLVAPGQEACFQIALRRHAPRYGVRLVTVTAEAPAGLCAEVRRVGLVPAELPAYPDRNDENYITTASGLFPDPLLPPENGGIYVPSEKWRAVWVSVRLPADLPAGDYPVTVRLQSPDEEIDETLVYTVSVASAPLPAQKLLYTQWFHCDSIADAHGVPVFSEEHWRLIGDYMRMAAQHGINVILTPVVTPPLDTAVGTERPTVQLVDVTQTADGYAFGFERFDRYVRLAQSLGIEQFEVSHLFTQWGALCAPKVVANVNGEVRRVFGWDTEATSPAYAGFLRALVPAVIARFGQLGVARDHLWFHVSDEPRPVHMESYSAAAAILAPLVEGCHRIDALSDFDFYRKGLVPTPVVASDRIEPFLKADVPGLWCYYCGGQAVGTSNRMFGMPLTRVRAIGVQLYRSHVAGFLHWGYNFYYTQLSRRRVDPYAETDAGGAFPAGDSFSVYPCGDTVAPSLNLKTFERALEDLRLLQGLEEKIGREATDALLDRVAGKPIVFTDSAFGEDFYRRLYTEIFRLL